MLMAMAVMFMLMLVYVRDACLATDLLFSTMHHLRNASDAAAAYARAEGGY
jgi:hypothetical protein